MYTTKILVHCDIHTACRKTFEMSCLDKWEGSWAVWSSEARCCIK